MQKQRYIQSLTRFLLTSFCLSLPIQAFSSESYEMAVKDLKSDPSVQKALLFLFDHQKKSIKDLVVLNEIPAPPFKESERAIKFAELLRESGLKNVSIDEIGNVIARRKGKGDGQRLVAYSAHLDTVFPSGTDVTVRHKDGKLYAPGIGDNSQGLVNLLEVARSIEMANLQTEADILFVGNVGEEGLGDLRGIKHLFRHHKIDALIAIDGSSPARIVYGGVGSHRYRVTFNGPGGHSWGAFGSVNPHHALGRAIEHFVNQAAPISAYGETSYNIGRIGGGVSVNTIPYESWFEVDLRSVEQSTLDKLDDVLHLAIQKAVNEENTARKLSVARGGEIEVDIKRVGTRPAAVAKITDALVQQSIAATLALGIKPQLRLSSTDANYPLSIGVSAVTLSRGGASGGAHSLNEWWDPKDAYIAGQIGLLTLLLSAGLAQ
ncbi:MAG: tripeptide aminopeptidase [Candidatus Azotimanducaceae bacterium]|jgi:tripeptide aminopeptidase